MRWDFLWKLLVEFSSEKKNYIKKNSPKFVLISFSNVCFLITLHTPLHADRICRDIIQNQGRNMSSSEKSEVCQQPMNNQPLDMEQVSQYLKFDSVRKYFKTPHNSIFAEVLYNTYAFFMLRYLFFRKLMIFPLLKTPKLGPILEESTLTRRNCAN